MWIKAERRFCNVLGDMVVACTTVGILKSEQNKLGMR
jgi:hypothetical protein